jgi:serine/threonine protein kinase
MIHKDDNQNECPQQSVIECYIQDSLKPDELSDFQRHLKNCKVCQARVNEAQENEKLLEELRTFDRKKTKIEKSPEKNATRIDDAQSLLGERYRVIRKIGEGSAGQVFQVADTVLDRIIAVKFLNQKQTATDEDSKRWQEARFMSRLNHPGIAQIYEIGELQEQRFIMMEWIDGLPLTEAWKNMPLQQRLSIYLNVLDAVAAAHERGIIHRDIKPSNILVNSGGKPKILDFGIAIETEYLSESEQSVYRGTPAYTAPEQITKPVQIFPSTDVFALGVLLYELLTDTLPFKQNDPQKLFNAIRNEYPELPNAIQEKVPISLQNICLKALEKDPKERYATARDLANDISRFLRGEKVWSRPSFVADKIQQEIFYHRQKLKVWFNNELLTQKEYDRLDDIYERVIAPPDPSITEARKLSFSQVCLYLGGWIIAIGCFVLFYKNWVDIPVFFRPLPAIFAAALMISLGILLWKKEESRLAVGFLATANLLIPITILLSLAQWNLLAADNYAWGTESIHEILQKSDSYLIFGNAQLFVSLLSWFAFSLFFLWLTRSSIFVYFGIISFLTWLTSCYIIAGMLGIIDETEPWKLEVIAARYLYPGIILFFIGTGLDEYKLSHYARPLCIVGLIMFVTCLSAIAISESTIFGWIFFKPESLDKNELTCLSFVFNGLLYLILAGVCRSIGTPLQRKLASIFNWLGPIHIIAPLRILDDVGPDTHALIYRILLPIASFAFVFGSVIRQMKSFFFSGLAGIAASIQSLTANYFDEYFTWPISLIITGIIWMLVSWLVPRWRADLILKSED